MDKNEFNAKLASQRIVLLPQEMTLKQVDTVRHWLTVLNLESPEPIKLIIDSDGGLTEPSLWIYDAIKLSQAPVIGIVSGRCKSMAVIVLQACTKRFSMPHSCFFLHPIKMRVTAACDHYLDMVIATRKRQMQQAQKLIDNILIEKTHLTRAQIQKLMRDHEKQGGCMLPQEAKKIGLIDQIIDHYNIWLPNKNA